MVGRLRQHQCRQCCSRLKQCDAEYYNALQRSQNHLASQCPHCTTEIQHQLNMVSIRNISWFGVFDVTVKAYYSFLPAQEGSCNTLSPLHLAVAISERYAR